VRKLLIAATCGVALAVSGPAQALAYGLAKGSGQGTAKITAASPLTITGTQASGWDDDSDSRGRILGGGGDDGSGRDAVPVTATISNPNTFHHWAHTVRASVLSTNKCAVTDFSVEGAPRQVDLPVVANGRLVVRGISVRLAKKANGGCKDAKVTLAYSIS
jgi:hypothetical protein